MSRSFSVRLMEERDIQKSVEITDLMDWGLDEEDFSFMMRLEPKGCFVATSNDLVIGVVTSISFGGIGWVGNVIVTPERRGTGIGAALLSQVLTHLKTEGVETVGLYAYRNVIPFYQNLGFKLDRDFAWLKCRKVSWKGESSPPIESSDVPAIVEFDEQCLGASRERLLKEIVVSPLTESRAAFEGGRPLAYVMASRSTHSAEIGPWVRTKGREKEAFQLLKSLGDALHGLETYIGVPSDKDLISFLSKLGFAEEFPVVRMYLGPAIPNRNCILAMESLERG